MKDSDWKMLHELYLNPNLTRVANKMYITQPSLTKRLQHMEQEFCITIVNRTSKGLEFKRRGSGFHRLCKKGNLPGKVNRRSPISAPHPAGRFFMFHKKRLYLYSKHQL